MIRNRPSLILFFRLLPPLLLRPDNVSVSLFKLVTPRLKTQRSTHLVKGSLKRFPPRPNFNLSHFPLLYLFPPSTRPVLRQQLRLSPDFPLKLSLPSIRFPRPTHPISFLSFVLSALLRQISPIFSTSFTTRESILSKLCSRS